MTNTSDTHQTPQDPSTEFPNLNGRHNSLLHDVTRALYALDDEALICLYECQGGWLRLDTGSRQLSWSFGSVDNSKTLRRSSSAPSGGNWVSVAVMFDPKTFTRAVFNADGPTQSIYRAQFGSWVRDHLVFFAADLANGLATAQKVDEGASHPEHPPLVVIQKIKVMPTAYRFPYPTLRVPTDGALTAVRMLRAKGQVPVMLGNEDEFSSLAFALSKSDLGAQRDLLARTGEVNVADWLADASDDATVRSMLENVAWPTDEPPVTLLWALHRKRERRPAGEEMVIGLLPVAESWMVPWLLPLPDASPSAHKPAAVARYWQQKFGAEITAVCASTVEYTVANPPQTRAEALALALQHYSVCDDIVTQNYGSVETLAAALLGATVWSFWWD